MSSRPSVPRGWRRRSVGDPGLKIRKPSAASSSGICECPNTTSSAAGNQRRSRCLRPAVLPLSSPRHGKPGDLDLQRVTDFSQAATSWPVRCCPAPPRPARLGKLIETSVAATLPGVQDQVCDPQVACHRWRTLRHRRGGGYQPGHHCFHRAMYAVPQSYPAVAIRRGRHAVRQFRLSDSADGAPLVQGALPRAANRWPCPVLPATCLPPARARRRLLPCRAVAAPWSRLRPVRLSPGRVVFPCLRPHLGWGYPDQPRWCRWSPRLMSDLAPARWCCYGCRQRWPPARWWC